MNWFKTQIEWLKGFFSERDGKASHKRLISLSVAFTFLFSYIKTTLVNSKIEDIPINWGFLIAAILGLGIYANKVNSQK